MEPNPTPSPKEPFNKIETAVKPVRIEWNGEPRDVSIPELKVTALAPGHFLVSNGSRVEEIFIADGKLSDGHALDGIAITIETERERIIRERFQGSASGGTVHTGARVIKAPMPGLVRSVKVTAGDLVKRDSTLLVLEAMKMENNILAGVAGRVERVLVGEGSSVEKNAALIEIELQ
ncbi:MAG TPA: biotin/lipoyl-containing protein [Candidatus Kapabacteria bacterium]|jgi:biotin carboxyl carrier protein|nr:biotin/lipoyl-containing protein [Candidatus Kapabacteria bacterium]